MGDPSSIRRLDWSDGWCWLAGNGRRTYVTGAHQRRPEAGEEGVHRLLNPRGGSRVAHPDGAGATDQDTTCPKRNGLPCCKHGSPSGATNAVRGREVAEVIGTS